MTATRLLVLVSWALTPSTAFVPHHRAAWSVRSASPCFASCRLSVSRSSDDVRLGNRNSTVFLEEYGAPNHLTEKEEDYDSTVASKQFYERQAINDLTEIQKLEELVQQDTQATFDPLHIEQESTITSVVSSSKEEEDEGFLSVIWRARLLLLGAAALYGTNFSIIKIMGDQMPVGISATLRFGLAALATLPWLLAPPKDGSSLIPPLDKSKSWWENIQTILSTTTIGATLAGLEVGAWNSIGYLAQAVGLETTDASKSAFICSLAVVIVPIMDVMSGKKLLPREISGALLAVAGVGFLEFGGAADLTLTSGDIASLLQPLMFGVAFWRMETAMRKYPDEANRSTAAQLMAVFLTSITYCMSTCTIDMAQIQGWLMDPMILGSLFFTGVITTALTVYMEAVALKTLTAAETTLILSTEPLWGAVFAGLLIGEQFGIDAYVGAALVIAGCVYSNLGMDGMQEMLGTKKKAATEEAELVIAEDKPVNVEDAEKAILEVGLIGVLVRLVAFLEANLAVSAATVIAAEEVVEEIIKDTQ